MPYLSLGFFGTYTGSQIASASGTFHNSSILWAEPIIAGIALLVALAQMFSAQHSSDVEPGKVAAIGLVVLATLTLLVILGKYFLIDIEPSTTSYLGYTTTGPALASFYSSGFWIYIMGIAAILVGGVFASRSSS